MMCYSSGTYRPPVFGLEKFRNNLIRMINLDDKYRLSKYLSNKAQVNLFNIKGLSGEDMKNGFEKITVNSINYSSCFPKGLESQISES